MARRSLGTLTVDLVARTGGFVQGMDKGSREAEKFRRKVKKDLEVVGTAFKLMGTAAAAGVATMTVQTIKASNEISRLSSIANAGAEEFQRYAVGAERFGISQEKLSDIFKDTADRVGDFLTTGGGPMLDFFEQIAPKVGVTAEQFRNLSGPQALQLYVDSLEKANVSQNEMVFFLEAIAGDASALLPLLRDGGAGFKVFGDEAARAGAIIGDDVLGKTDELAAAQLILEQNFEGVRNKIAADIIPVLTQLSTMFIGTGEEALGAKDDVNELEVAFKAIAVAGIGLSSTLEIIGKGLAGLAAAAATGSLEPLKAAFEDIDGVVEDASMKINDLILGDPGLGAPPPGSTEDRLAKIAALLKEARDNADSARNSISGGSGIGGSSRTPGAPSGSPSGPAPVDPDDPFLLPQEQFKNVLAGREEIFQEHKDAMVEIERATNGQLSDAARQLLGEQSGIYQGLFALEKGVAIGRSIIAIQTAIAQASASGPFPANIAAMASVASATAGLISTIASTNIQGQAHDGLMSVPKTGTYLLEKGERVTTAETSAKLDQTLSQMQGGGGVRIVNAFDTSVVGDYMGSTSGERVIMNVVKKNQRQLRTIAS